MIALGSYDTLKKLLYATLQYRDNVVKHSRIRASQAKPRQAMESSCYPLPIVMSPPPLIKLSIDGRAVSARAQSLNPKPRVHHAIIFTSGTWQLLF